MNPNGENTSTAATDFTPEGATVGASPAPEQQGTDETQAKAQALSDFLSPPQTADSSGQQVTAPIETSNPQDPQTAPAVPRDRRAVEGRHKEDIRRADRDGYNRAVTELESRFSAFLDSQLAPYKAMMEQQAAKAIMQEHPGITLELATELAQARAAKASTPLTNQQVSEDSPQQAQQRPRDAQGRFVTQNSEEGEHDEVSAARERAGVKAQELRKQADEIRQMYSIDMMDLFQRDEEIKQGILQDRDFYWALAVLDRRPNGGHQAGAPPIVRQPHFTGNAGSSFRDMPGDQFKKLNQELRNGKKVDTRK